MNTPLDPLDTRIEEELDKAKEFFNVQLNPDFPYVMIPIKWSYLPQYLAESQIDSP